MRVFFCSCEVVNSTVWADAGSERRTTLLRSLEEGSVESVTVVGRACMLE